MHATGYLKSPDQTEITPVVILHGADRYLRQNVLAALTVQLFGEGDHSENITRYEGKNVELKTVLDELYTISMWSDCRLVVIDDAEDFVSQFRSGLEKYVEKPAKKSVFVLATKKWQKSTKLAKKLAKTGLVLECAELKGAELEKWLVEIGRELYQKKLSRNGAQLMIELAGNDLGLLDQELDKLAAFTGENEKIEMDDIRKLVGGWKAETTWEMLNAIRDGRSGIALEHLEKLLNSGEAPQKILGGLNFVYRKLAQATELARLGIPLNDALKKAGVFPRDIQSSSGYLRKIGRPKAENIYSRLLKIDSNMKGGSRLDSRIQLEKLLISLSGS
jgi:DNA polymerase III subunit delta